MEAKTRKLYNPLTWDWKFAGETVVQSAGTALVLLFIVNGLATFLILFGWVEAGEFWKHVFGSLSFGFSAVALVMFTNRGVKHQSKSKKARK